MATIYRFIVEQKSTQGGGRKGESGYDKKTPAKKGKYVSILGGEKGGVEHNRKMRAINPLLNKATGGWWEKGMRLGRAGAGLITKNTETGKIGISGPAIAIIIAFVIQMFMKWQKQEATREENRNTNNFRKMEMGVGTINTQFKLTEDLLTGKLTYNQNK